jgi:hypothetical protein
LKEEAGPLVMPAHRGPGQGLTIYDNAAQRPVGAPSRADRSRSASVQVRKDQQC